MWPKTAIKPNLPQPRYGTLCAKLEVMWGGAHCYVTLRNLFMASDMATEWKKLRAEVEEK